MKDDREIPFAVARSGRASLVEQVTDGLRQCILSGFYRPGDVLPTTRDLAVRLGVSRIVTRAAVRALASEELINPKPSVGCVVLGRKGKLWRGNVLFVQTTSGRTFYVNVFASALRARLLKAGWLFSEVSAFADAAGKDDLAELEIMLTRPLSLAVSIFDNPGAENALSRSGVPFVTINDKAECRLRGCAGHVRFDRQADAGSLAAACARLGVKSVLQVGPKRFDDLGAALKAVGIASRHWEQPRGAKSLEEYALKARDAFAARLARSRSWLPDLIYFANDYVCAGALPAIAAAGVRVPEDVRVVTWSNRGNGPFFSKDLARMEMNPVGDADTVADAILARLGGDPAPVALTLSPTFRDGPTLA